MLDVTYLIAWGARWGPLLQRQPYRWFSSWFLHQSFTHVLSNMLLFLAVGCQARCLCKFSAQGPATSVLFSHCAPIFTWKPAFTSIS